MPLGEHVALEPLEPADDLAGEPAHLGEVAGDGQRLGADALPDRLVDAGRGASARELAAISARPSICARARSSAASTAPGSARPSAALEPLSRALDRVVVHGGTVAFGRMKRTELEYALPPELIAQRPAERRDASRLLVYERASGAIRHRRFVELADELSARSSS